MYSKSLSLFLFLSLVINLQAQESYKKHEFSFTNDNDVYLLKDSDKYYSNGMILNYRWSPASKFLIEGDSSKRVLDLEVAQKIYTPQDVLFRSFEIYDRPYAGLLYAGLSMSQFKNKTLRTSAGFKLGVVGDASGAQEFQEWYHNAVGFDSPRGWKFQIPNEVVFNFDLELNKQFFLVPDKLDVISSSELSFGSTFTHVLQRFDLRIGRLQWLSRSSFKNALIGKGSESTPRHFYFFLGYGLQYVLHNITIEGSIWNDDAIHTEDALPWVRHLRLGWAVNSHRTTFRMTYNWRGPEVSGISRHAYISLELSLRFPPRRN